VSPPIPFTCQPEVKADGPLPVGAPPADRDDPRIHHAIRVDDGGPADAALLRRCRVPPSCG
jgi:hypothetical protein